MVPHHCWENSLTLTVLPSHSPLHSLRSLLDISVYDNSMWLACPMSLLWSRLSASLYFSSLVCLRESVRMVVWQVPLMQQQRVSRIMQCVFLHHNILRLTLISIENDNYKHCSLWIRTLGFHFLHHCSCGIPGWHAIISVGVSNWHLSPYDSWYPLCQTDSTIQPSGS